MPSRQTSITIVALLFVISGAVGLVYQIVWFKFLSLFLGNTTYAQTIVLATFMGGIAIGSVWGGRIADRHHSLLRIYAFLELGIGLYCVFYPALLSMVQSGFVRAAIGFGLSSGHVTTLVLKLLVSLLTLLLPTILMGGTLPILARFISTRLQETGRNIAVLYFLNSFGAIVGTILAGFFFIRILGLHLTIYSGAVVSLLIGLAAFVLSWRSPALPARSEPEEEIPAADGEGPDARWAAVIVAGLSGAAAMVFEVTWVRMLIPILGSSTYSFSIMLTGVISGITIGSLIATSLLGRPRNALRLLAVCQFGVVAALLATIPLYSRLPYMFWIVARVFARTEATYPLFLLIQFAFSLVIVLLPTVFLGISLPVSARIATRTMRSLGRSVGNVFAVNTLGTVVGSLGAGLILIPLIGVRHAMEAGVILNLSAGLLVLTVDRTASLRKRWGVATVAVVGTAVCVLSVPDWGRVAMLAGVFRQVTANAPPPESYTKYREGFEHANILFYKEGASATVGVVRSDEPEGPQNVLIINGKADASSRGDLPTQVLIGELPMLLHPHPASALVIGLGSGVTAGSILRHPVERLDCVEISPEVVQASTLFDSTSRMPLKDPRMTLTIEDALAFLNLTPRDFDVIVSEPSNPWIAGVGNLYTTDFFEACKRKMNRGGLMVQWFHLYEMDDELFQLVLRTFQESFPYVSVWQSLTSDVILLGSSQPVPLDDERICSVLGRRTVQEDFARIGIMRLSEIYSLRIMADESVRRYAGIGPTNTEDLPLLEFQAPRAFFVNRGVSSILLADERMKLGVPLGLLSRARADGKLRDEDLRSIGMLHTRKNRGNLSFGSAALRAYLERHPADVDVLNRLEGVAGQMHDLPEQIELLRRLVALEPRNFPLHERYAWARYSLERSRANVLTGFDIESYVVMLRGCIQASADTVDRYRIRLGDVYYHAQEYGKAVDQYARALQIRAAYADDPEFPDDVVLLQLARCLHELHQTERALGYAFRASVVNRNNADVSDFIYQVWMRRRAAAPDTAGRN